MINTVLKKTLIYIVICISSISYVVASTNPDTLFFKETPIGLGETIESNLPIVNKVGDGIPAALTGGAMPSLMGKVSRVNSSETDNVIFEGPLIFVEGNAVMIPENNQIIQDTIFNNENGRLDFKWGIRDENNMKDIPAGDYNIVITLTDTDANGDTFTDTFTFNLRVVEDIPTLSQWGLFLFGLGMAILALVFVYNKTYRTTVQLG